MNRTFLLAIGTVVCLSASSMAADSKVDVSKLPPAASKSDVTFASDIKPLFEKSCVKCHGVEKPKGKLRLDTLEATLKGGESGKSIMAGKSAESKLVHSIAYLGEEDYHMPPPGNKAGIKQLTKEEISLVRAWIDQGAK